MTNDLKKAEIELKSWMIDKFGAEKDNDGARTHAGTPYFMLATAGRREEGERISTEKSLCKAMIVFKNSVNQHVGTKNIVKIRHWPEVNLSSDGYSIICRLAVDDKKVPRETI